MNLHSVPNWPDQARTVYANIVNAADSGDHERAAAFEDDLKVMLVQAVLDGAAVAELKAIAALAAAAVFLPGRRSE